MGSKTEYENKLGLGDYLIPDLRSNGILSPVAVVIHNSITLNKQR